MRVRPLVLGLVALSLGWGLLAGCGGPMPSPPEQDQTPMAADRSQDDESDQRQAERPTEPAPQDGQQDAREGVQTESTSEASSERFAVAKAIIRQQSCGSCHTLQGQGLDLSGQVGPDLTNEGERGRSDAWLRRHLVDPTSIPDDEVVDGFEGMQSTMPSYGRRLSSAELDALIQFLQSLNGADD